MRYLCVAVMRNMFETYNVCDMCLCSVTLPQKSHDYSWIRYFNITPKPVYLKTSIKTDKAIIQFRGHTILCLFNEISEYVSHMYST